MSFDDEDDKHLTGDISVGGVALVRLQERFYGLQKEISALTNQMKRDLDQRDAQFSQVMAFQEEKYQDVMKRIVNNEAAVQAVHKRLDDYPKREDLRAMSDALANVPSASQLASLRDFTEALKVEVDDVKSWRVGRLGQEKGIATTLKAIAAIFTFLVVGGGWALLNAIGNIAGR